MHSSVLFLFLVLWTSALADSSENFRKCGRLAQPGNRHCCKQPPSEPKIDDMEDLKGCFKQMAPLPSCEHDLCIATKKGFATADGKPDKKAFQSLIETGFKDSPDVIKAIKEKCVEGDISKYGPSDFCDLTKLRHCFQVQLALQCTEWDTEGHCSSIAELAEECKKLE